MSTLDNSQLQKTQLQRAVDLFLTWLETEEMHLSGQISICSNPLEHIELRARVDQLIRTSDRWNLCLLQADGSKDNE